MRTGRRWRLLLLCGAVCGVMLTAAPAGSTSKCVAHEVRNGVALTLALSSVEVDGQPLPSGQLPSPTEQPAGGYRLANDAIDGSVDAVLYDPEAPGFVRRGRLRR